MVTLLLSSVLILNLDPAAELTAALDSYAAKHFSGMLYVEQNGKEIYFHGVGLADQEAKRPFTRDSVIEIGSIVKPISKIAWLKLQEAGKLSMSDRLTKYFDNVPDDKKGITLQMVADHRAGFQDVFGDDYDPMKRDDLIDKLLHSERLYKPGADYKYSNSGYSLLATVIEKVTGKSFEEVCSELEFKPLGLTKTGYVIPHWSNDQICVGYKMDGSRWGTPLDHFWFKDGPGWNLRGNGGMLSTVHELATWVLAANDGRLLSKDDYAAFIPAFAKPNVAPNSIWGVAGGNGIWDTVALFNPSRHLVVITTSTDARFEIESVLKDLKGTILSLGDKTSADAASKRTASSHHP